MIRLNLGSGPFPLKDYTNVDLYRSADVQMNAITLPGYEINSVDEIRASHLLEHFGKGPGIHAVRRWYQVLKPGGKITIIVPDVVQSIRWWLEAYDRGEHVWNFRSQCIWGDQAHDGEYHRWGYDDKRLYALLVETGFKEVVIDRIDGHDHEFGNRPDWFIEARAVK